MREEFINKAKQVHGDKYDYSKVNYINQYTKVCIICSIHGEFWQTPYNHLNGNGCPSCARGIILSTGEFIQKARAIHGDKYDYSKVEYVNKKTPICIICPEHGEFWQKPSNHLIGYGCKKCQYTKIKKDLSLTTEQFIEKARKIHGNKYDYSKVVYEKSSKKVCIICPEHGEFWQTPNDHLDNHGCMKCRDEKTKKILSGTTDTFIQKARIIHGDKYDYSRVEYIGNDKKVCIICPEHGEFWQTPHSHLRGSGCPHKSHKLTPNKLTTEKFIEKARKIHGDKYDYSKVEYNTGKDKVCIICPQHGEFWQRAEDHLYGHGCSACNDSNLERLVSNLLIDNNIQFIYQYYPFYLNHGKSHKSLDFFLPEYNIAIECQGEQHFKPTTFGGIDEQRALENYNTQIKRDIEKHDSCLKNGIQIIYFTKYTKENYLYDIISEEIKLINTIRNEKRDC